MSYQSFFFKLFTEQGLSELTSKYLNAICLFVLMVIVLFISDFLSKKILVSAFKRLSDKTRTTFDDLILEYKTTDYIAHLVPFLISLKLVPVVFYDFPILEYPLEILLDVYIILLIVRICRSLLKTTGAYIKTFPRLKNKPIDSYTQVVMLFVWTIGGATILVILTGIEIKTFFTTLGAASAILLLVFKDTILGLVASIQVAINDTVRIGDWISMEKFGADGNVISISLSTVQVQNFDMTITNIPTYTLVSESFKNWRGMAESDGRRIKRSVIIKTSSIKFLTQNEIDKLKSIALISEYLERKSLDISDFNSNNKIDKSILINGRNLTNIGVFRKFINTYIENHSAINKDMTIMVRQLSQTEHGVPLEIYAFSNDQRWENYEFIVSDVFDHIIASVSYFDLEVYELSNVS